MKNKPGSNTPNLADRWTESCRDGDLPVGKLGRADVSSWAHATSKPFGSVFKPRRPEVGIVRQEFQPIRKLSAIRPMMAVLADHNPASVCIPCDSRESTVERPELQRTISIAKAFEGYYQSRRIALAKPQQPKPEVDILADCPKTDPSVIARLKDQQLPREL